MSPGRLVPGTLAGLLMAAFPAPASSQDIPAPLLACTGEANDTRRLACFDAALEKLRRGSAAAAAAAPAASPAVAAGPPAASAGASPAPAASAGTPRLVSPEDEFGLRGEVKEEKAGELSELVSTVTDVRAKPHGELVVTLANGQVWEEIATGSKIKLEAGDTVKIEKGVLRSFILIAPSGRSSKVSRTR